MWKFPFSQATHPMETNISTLKRGKGHTWVSPKLPILVMMEMILHLEIWIWRPGTSTLWLLDKAINKNTEASSALAKVEKSGSGGQGSEMDACSKQHNQIMIASKALASFWISGSGSQAYAIDVFSKGTNMKMIVSKALARSGKAGSWRQNWWFW